MKLHNVTLLTLLAMLFIAGCAGKQETPPDSSGVEEAGSAASPEMPDPAETDPATPPSEPTPAEPSASNDPSPAAAVDSTLSYVTEDVAVAIVLRPSKALNNPLVKEIMKVMESVNPDTNFAETFAEAEENLGVKPEQIDHVVINLSTEMLGMAPMLLPLGDASGIRPQRPIDPLREDVPRVVNGELRPVYQDAEIDFPAEPGFGGPMAAPPLPWMVIQLVDGLDAPQILAKLAESKEGAEKITVNGKDAFKKDNGVLYPISSTRVLLAPEDKLDSLLTPAAGSLVKALEPISTRDLAIAVNMQPVQAALQQMQGGGPNPFLGMAMPLVMQMQTLTISADLEGESLLAANIAAINADSATGLHGMLNGFLMQGKQQYAAAQGEVPADLQPIVQNLVDGAAMTVNESDVNFVIPRPEGFEQLPTLLKPAMEKAAEAAKQSVRKNNLKMIGLAFHNHHSIHESFPAIDSNGTAEGKASGLSWRVHLLPMLGDDVLYEEFHLDEPWDSDHNKTLIEKMPEYLGENAEGKTRFHVFTGEKTPFPADAEQGVKLRDILDGSSNTILVVEAGEDKAEIWTKPSGLEFNEDNPIAALGEVGDAFFALFADGSVRPISAEIDAANLSRLIQHQDGEPVEGF